MVSLQLTYGMDKNHVSLPDLTLYTCNICQIFTWQFRFSTQQISWLRGKCCI